MPGLVPPAALPRANALESMSYGVADVAGPALAGVLAATLGPSAALAGQAALAALCLALLAALPAAVPPAEDRPADVRRALAAGARLLLRTPALRGVTTTSLLGAACFGLLTVALPTLAARLTGDTAAAGGLYAAIAGGAIAGAAVLPCLEGRVPAAALVQGASAAQGLVFVVIGLVGTTTPVALALCVVCGLPQGLALAALFAVRIECTPPALRSQVFTSVAGMKAGFGAAGAAASGVLVAAYGPGATIALVGLGLVAATGLGVACSRHADLRLPLPGVRRALRGARP